LRAESSGRIEKRGFCCLKGLRVLTDQELFERFLETVFRVSGFDRFSFLERILQLNSEFIEKLGGEKFSPFGTELVLRGNRYQH